MKLLLDTHVLLGVLAEPDRLKVETRHLLTVPANDVFVNVVALWEIVVKRWMGKLEADIAAIIAKLAPASELQLLGVASPHLMALNNLPFHEQHRDLFDHLMIAQAMTEGMILITQDRHAPLYPVQVLAP